MLMATAGQHHQHAGHGGRIERTSTTSETLRPARQAALQAVTAGGGTLRLGASARPPHVRTFLRLLTGNSRMNTTVAQRIPGLNWDLKHRLSSLKQVEEALMN